MRTHIDKHKNKTTNTPKLDPVGSTVRYEVMKLCIRSVWESNGWYLVVPSQYKAVTVLNSIKVLSIYAFNYMLKKGVDLVR